MESKFLGKSWSSRLESVVADLASEIPEVGSVVSALIAIFWPETGDPWEEIEEQAKALIDRELFNERVQNYNDRLKDIGAAMQEYVAVAGVSDKGAQLLDAITKGGELRRRLHDDNTEAQRAQIIPLWASVAHMELASLREKYQHLDKLFPGDDPAEALKELNDAYGEYEAFFDSVVPNFFEWRMSPEVLSVVHETGSFEAPSDEVKVADAVTGEKWDASGGGENLVGLVRQRIKGEATAALASAMSSVTYLSRYLPGHDEDGPRIHPYLQIFPMGPYLAGTLAGPGEGTNEAGYDVSDKVGRITTIAVGGGSEVEAIKASYVLHEGAVAGAGTPNVPVHIELPKARAGGLTCTFNLEEIDTLSVVQTAQPPIANPPSDPDFVAPAPMTFGTPQGALKVGQMTVDSSYEMVGLNHSVDQDEFSTAKGKIIRLGGQFAHSAYVDTLYPGFAWSAINGNANRDIALGPDNAWWITDNGGVAWLGAGDGNWAPFKREGAVLERIAIGSGGLPWAVDNDGVIYQMTGTGAGSTWEQVAGWEAQAVDIGAGGDGSLWAVDRDGKIHRLLDGTWTAPAGPGSLTRVSVSNEGIPWVIDDQHEIFRLDGTKWTQLPGHASDIAVVSDGAQMAWVLGIGSGQANQAIYYFEDGNWKQISGSASSIAAFDMGTPAVIQTDAQDTTRGIVISRLTV